MVRGDLRAYARGAVGDHRVAEADREHAFAEQQIGEPLRSDGVAQWTLCLEEEGPERENIEVVGSHIGLGHNPAVAYAVADRLAQPEGDWRPFAPPFPLRHLYPSPAVWERKSA